MSRHIKSYMIYADFPDIESAIKAYGILQGGGYRGGVVPADGSYHLNVASFKTKRATEMVLKELHDNYNYIFKIKKGK